MRSTAAAKAVAELGRWLHNSITVKYAFPFVVAILVAACSQRDGREPEYFVGNWTNAETGDFTLRPDGSFQGGRKSAQKELRFEGTWFVSNSVLVSTITNVIARNIETSNLAPVGTIERAAIIPIDSNHFVLRYEASSNYFRTNLYTRRP